MRIGVPLLLLACLLVPFGLHAQSDKESVLTADEREWLEANIDRLYYAPHPSWPPMDYVDEDGAHRGVVADYLKAIESKSGVTFPKRTFANWSDLLQGISRGDAMFTGGIQRTEEREAFLDFTTSYLEVPVMLVMRDDGPTITHSDQISSLKVAVVKDYASEEYLSSKWPGVEIVHAPTDLDALMLTVLGSTDASLIDLGVASYYVGKFGLSDLSIGPDLGYSYHLRFATRSDEPQFTAILHKLFDAVSEEQRNAIIDSHVKLHKLPSSSASLKYLLIALYSAAILGFLVIVLLVLNLYLRKRVEAKTAMLRKEMAAREAALATIMSQHERLREIAWVQSHKVRAPLSRAMSITALLQSQEVEDMQWKEFMGHLMTSLHELDAVVAEVVERSTEGPPIPPAGRGKAA